MYQVDLKRFVYGKHAQRLLSVCGIRLPSSEPPPKVIGRLPSWFRTAAAVLTLVGIVAGVRMVDRVLTPRPSGPIQEADVSGLGNTGWKLWVHRQEMRADTVASSHSSDPASVGTDRAPEGSGGRSAIAQTPSRIPRREIHPTGYRFERILVTAYTSASNVDGSTQLTAANSTPKPGTIALSRDLLRTFTQGAPFDWGDKVLIPGVGIFVVKDAMGPQWTAKADIWLASAEKANAWGARTVFLTRLAGNAPVLTLDKD